MADAATKQRPLAVLFQEVPGCAGCRQYGKDVLSSPLIVEALEDNFVPVAVFNNTGGRDRELLTRFKEPAWNYQVMRFMNTDLKDVVPRQDQVWSVGATARRLASALKREKRPVPNYLTNVLIPETDPDVKIAVFAMYCFLSLIHI